MIKEYVVEVLSPVHIGNGNKISPIEYILDNKFYRINMDSLFEEESFDVDGFIENVEFGSFYLGDFYGDIAKKNKSYVLEVSNSAKKYLVSKKTEIFEFIKSGGTPYIPGSSIKGAIRTAIFWHMLKENPEIYSKMEEYLNGITNGRIKAPQKKFVDDKIEKVVFGKDPKYDLLKALMVTDTNMASFSQLYIHDVRILTTLKNGYTWKGWHSIVEALNMGAKLKIEIKKDGFFTRKDISRELGFEDKVNYLDDIAKICNEYARDFIEYEMQFFSRYNDGDLDEIIKFYEKLKNEEGILLHISWGSGWHGMTVGRLFDENILNLLRQKYELGKIVHKLCGNKVSKDKRRKGMWFCKRCEMGNLGEKDIEIVKPFPKTRKIVFEDEKPKYPMGWIKLEEIK